MRFLSINLIISMIKRQSKLFLFYQLFNLFVRCADWLPAITLRIILTITHNKFKKTELLACVSAA